MNRKILLLILGVVVIILIFFKKTDDLKKESAASNKPKFLCDQKITDCVVPHQKQIPKGVCAPGIACTQSTG